MGYKNSHVNMGAMKILVVDDIMTMRSLLRHELRQLGYEDVETAENGLAALKKILTQKFDLVIADWNMPGLTGINLLRTVREKPELKNIKFLMVTAEAKEENILDAKEAGVDDYILKPFAPAILKEKIEMMFKSG